jgi:pyruvate,water dikinase
MRDLEVNGYLYSALVPPPEGEEARARRAESYLRSVHALHALGETLFGSAIVPEVEAGTRRLASVDQQALGAPELAAHFEDSLRWYEHTWSLHFMMDPWDETSPIGRCAAVYRELTGDENPWAVYAPFGHAPQKEHDGVAGLVELARLVNGSPALLALFRAHEPEAVWRALEATEDGPAFLRRLNELLEAFGLHCGASQGVLGGQVLPGWRDDPARVVALVQRYLPQDLDALAAAYRRAGEQYERDVTALRERVVSAGGTPEQLASFERWFAAAQRMITSILDHNHTIDSPANALLHRALMACGRRLAAAGAIDTAADVWWLRAHQIAAALRGLAAIDQPDWRALVAAHKALHAWQRSLTPPAYLGAPPPPARPAEAPPPAEEAPPNLLVRGQGAVPGVATGRVRLVDAHATVPDIQPGDVFVAPDCGMLWAVVLPVAAAVVLDGSYPHEHAMRVCRDFGVPGVVQARDATRVLREGQRVTVDGAKGWVLAAE